MQLAVVIRIVITLADHIAAGLVHGRRHVGPCLLLRLAGVGARLLVLVPVRVDGGRRARGLEAPAVIRELRHGARRVVPVGRLAGRDGCEADRLVLARVVRLRRISGRRRLLGVLLAEVGVVGGLVAGGTPCWWYRAGGRDVLGHLSGGLVRGSGRILFVVADEEEDAETDQRKTGNTSYDTTDNGADVRRRTAGVRRRTRAAISAVVAVAIAVAVVVIWGRTWRLGT